MRTPVFTEPLLGYHPCVTGFLTCSRDPAGGQCQVGSLTGALTAGFSEEELEEFRDMLDRMIANLEGLQEIRSEKM